MSTPPLVIAGGAAVTPSGVLDPADVVIDAGRIVAVEPPGRTVVPADAAIIDAAGCWVTAGFIVVQIN
jgi:N-acetylglucosamine-6-phosphate deacetylase